jgi:hypothetical protein
LGAGDRGLRALLRRAQLTPHVRSPAANDAEPDWDHGFWRTRDFYRGYRWWKPGYLLYNYGSDDGGIGAIWNARQLWHVTGGMRYARPIPEIYHRPMAEQWEDSAASWRGGSTRRSSSPG